MIGSLLADFFIAKMDQRNEGVPRLGLSPAFALVSTMNGWMAGWRTSKRTMRVSGVEFQPSPR